jgi:uncharacterized protein
MADAVTPTTLLAALSPELRAGEFVLCSLPGATECPDALATVREAEGLSVVLPVERAPSTALESGFRAAWISLRVDSSPEAVGLTAAVSDCLARHGIACNVVAGFHHDHLLVPYERRLEALQALEALAESSRHARR